mmetsp:Transcript_59041/g.156706  ORF Transcript_59041/g.156706 Transcript_59041/m.156706 type:complete len:276 (+) Transcript_59041:190-1017(+)
MHLARLNYFQLAQPLPLCGGKASLRAMPVDLTSFPRVSGADSRVLARGPVDHGCDDDGEAAEDGDGHDGKEEDQGEPAERLGGGTELLVAPAEVAHHVEVLRVLVGPVDSGLRPVDLQYSRRQLPDVIVLLRDLVFPPSRLPRLDDLRGLQSPRLLDVEVAHAELPDEDVVGLVAELVGVGQRAPDLVIDEAHEGVAVVVVVDKVLEQLVVQRGHELEGEAVEHHVQRLLGHEDDPEVEEHERDPEARLHQAAWGGGADRGPGRGDQPLARFEGA